MLALGIAFIGAGMMVAALFCGLIWMGTQSMNRAADWCRRSNQ